LPRSPAAHVWKIEGFPDLHVLRIPPIRADQGHRGKSWARGPSDLLNVEQRVLQVNFCLDGLDLRGIGGIEDMQIGESFNLPKREPQDFWAKLDLHPEEKSVLESACLTSAASEVRCSI